VERRSRKSALGITVRDVIEAEGRATITSVRTTENYTHVSRRHLSRICSPLDEPADDEEGR